MVSLLLLVIPPVSADHRTDVIAESLGDVKARHSISGDSLGHSFDKDFFPHSRKEFLLPTLDFLPDSFLEIVKSQSDRPAQMDRQAKITVRESFIRNVKNPFELSFCGSGGALAEHNG
jgi:hypothetical protein